MRGGLGQESSGEKSGLRRTSRADCARLSGKLEISKNESEHGSKAESAEREERRVEGF